MRKMSSWVLYDIGTFQPTSPILSKTQEIAFNFFISNNTPSDIYLKPEINIEFSPQTMFIGENEGFILNRFDIKSLESWHLLIRKNNPVIVNKKIAKL